MNLSTTARRALLVLLVSLTAAAQEAATEAAEERALAQDAPAASGAEAPPDAPPEPPPEVKPEVPAQAPAQGVRASPRLGYRLAVDGPVTVVAWALWITTENLKPRLAPATCRWCAPNAVDRGVGNALVWDDFKSAQKLSDVMLFVVSPGLALATTLTLAGVDGRMGEALWDVLLVAEAAGLAALTTQTVKFFVARERPFAHRLSAEEKALVDHPGDNNLSFYSGHASSTFAVAAATATVARMRGRRYAKWAWVVCLPVAAGTAYLRLAGDKHYLSDVLVGAALGTATGILVPALHDWPAFRAGGLPVKATAAFVPMPGGALGTVSLRW